MDDLFALISPNLLLFAVAVTILGGFVKGAVGFAMPLVMVSGMGIVMAPELVVAGIILPIVAANALQVGRAGLGEARSAVREHWPYISIVCAMIFVSAQFLRAIPTDTMFLVLGIPVVALCAVQLAGWAPRINPDRKLAFSAIAGLAAGSFGGLAAIWGPPTVLYLLALDTPKARQMAVQGVIYGLGSLMLLLGHLQSGVLNAQSAQFSAILILPSLFGMWLGFKLGDRFDQARFRRVTLIVLTVAGVNLIRRGLMG